MFCKHVRSCGAKVKHIDFTCLITKLLIHNSLPLKQLTASCLHIKQFAVTSSAFRLFTCERLSLRPFNLTVLHLIRSHYEVCVLTVEVNSSGLELLAATV